MNLSPRYNHSSFQEGLLQVLSKSFSTFLGVIEKDTRKYIYINTPGLSMFEWDDSGLVLEREAGIFLKDHISREDAQRILEVTWEKGEWNNELEFTTRNGKVFWGKIMITPFSHEGKGFFLIQIDKADRAKYAEDKLKEEKQQFGAFLDYASMGIVVANKLGKIVRINPFALQMFGYEEKDIIGNFIEVLIPSKLRERHIGHRDRFSSYPQNRPMGTGMDLFAVRKDGIEFPVEVSLGTYSSGDEIFVIAFVSDITIRKSAELEIKKLNDELEDKVKERTRQLTDVLSKLEESEKELKKLLEKEKELGELKSRFVSMASHEFRTPLSTILSSTYLLEKYTTSEEQPKRARHIDRILSSVNMLTDILNDFLSVGKIEEGKIQVRPSSFNIRELFDSLINDIRNIQKKGQLINYHHKGDETIVSDASLLKHMTINLIANAIKFSPENSQIVVVSESLSDRLVLRVKDQGMGISEEDQQHLFERFFRGGNATNIQGTGLGLHIVARYAELMNGKVECISELGKGAEFILTVQTSNEAIIPSI